MLKVSLTGKTYRRTLCSVRASVTSNALKTLDGWQRDDKKYINWDGSLKYNQKI